MLVVSSGIAIFCPALEQERDTVDCPLHVNVHAPYNASVDSAPYGPPLLDLTLGHLGPLKEPMNNRAQLEAERALRRMPALAREPLCPTRDNNP